jgi:DNA excision repair protein ERCC-2
MILKRFSRADKRSKLPKWIQAGMSEGLVNLSTDMAVAISKKFLRAMGQPFEHSQLGVSLWDSDMVNEVSKKEGLAVSGNTIAMDIDPVEELFQV